MALGSESVASASGALKKIYQEGEAKDALYKDYPFFGMLEVDNCFGGDTTFNITVQNGTQQGVSADFTQAQAAISQSQYTRFILTQGNLYGFGKIDRKLVLAGKKGRYALVNALERAQRGLVKEMKRHISNFLFGDGTGRFGQSLSSSTNTITLVDPTQVVWFEIDQIYVCSATVGGAPKSGSLQVSKVDRANGIVTFTTNVTTGIATYADGDYFFIRGNNSNANGGTTMVGLEGWIPSTATVSATPFFGVDRSVDGTRLGGLRFFGNGAPIQETIQNALPFALQEGASPDVLLMNPYDAQSFVNSVQMNTRYTEAKNSKITVGYKGFEVASPSGDLTMYVDPGCPKGKAYALTMDTWKLYTLSAGKDFPELVEDDGLTLYRDPNSDAYLWRMAAYGNLGCDNPSENMVIVF